MFAKLACTMAALGALASAAALFANASGITLPQFSFPILFVSTLLSVFPVILVNYKMRADDGDLFGWGIYALLWRAHILLIAICAASLLLVLFALKNWSDEAGGYALFLMFHVFSATLMFLVYRNPQLVWGCLCPNGHSVKHYNRFCPVCGALLAHRESA